MYSHLCTYLVRIRGVVVLHGDGDKAERMAGHLHNGKSIIAL